MERKNPFELKGEEISKWIRAQESFEKKKNIEKYSEPVEPLDPDVLIENGFQQIDRDENTYFEKKLGNGVELKRLDENNREIEHWLGTADVLEIRYDEEGYVVSSTHLKGTGWGSEKVITYTRDKNGKKVLSEITTQNFIGDPTLAWEAERPIRGKNIGEPIPTYIKK